MISFMTKLYRYFLLIIIFYATHFVILKLISYSYVYILHILYILNVVSSSKHLYTPLTRVLCLLRCG